MSSQTNTYDALVVGAGPAGLMAADMLSAAGLSTCVAEAKPSPGRKLLMAGKSGLNLTKDEDLPQFLQSYSNLAPQLWAALEAFGPQDVKAWAEGLGQSLFTGSTGRVFPVAKKASPLLRAWLARLSKQGVTLQRNWQLISLGASNEFNTPLGQVQVQAKVVILALGGASWARLGSNGDWVDMLAPYASCAPFTPSNVGVQLDWSAHMAPHFGAAIKSIALKSGGYHSRGEMVVSSRGLEGGGVYAVSRGFRDGAPLEIDLLPDLSHAALEKTLKQRNTRKSVSQFLRQTLKLPPAKVALINEFARPYPRDLSTCLKALTISPATSRPLDEAISTGGGVRFDDLDAGLALRKLPHVYAVGEMLDWDAPTGGYLLTACLATGRHAAMAALTAVGQA